jgi:hypothetical protein
MAESSAARRRVMRAAERAFVHPHAPAAPEIEGVTLGEPITLSPDDLEAELEADREVHPISVGITVFFADTPVEDRGAVEDPLADFLETHDLGEWLGSGQGSFGDEAFFDMSFAVNGLEAAVPILLRKLRALGAGPRTELRTSDDRTFTLGSAA